MKLRKSSMEFEIHITILNNKPIDIFRRDCLEMGLKPILINLGNEEQLMTSSKHRYGGDMRDILVPLYCKLQFEKGYDVIRLKVEKKPESIKDVNFKYYETHFRLKLQKGFNYDIIREECKKQNFHLSKNIFKEDIDFIHQMITYRTKNGTLNQFNMVVNKMKDTLNNFNIEFDKVEVEECIFDTKEELDFNWLN
jgi:hypothetical protein